jgi:glycosyltransferase involved in cell wall biosynthesis
MRILMVAPQPVLRSRGTPLSVYQRILCLTQLGHEVELATYPFGDPVDIPGLVVRRSQRPWGVRDVGIGPTPAKILLDAPLFRLATKMAASGRFDLLHTHEEAGMLGAHLSRRFGIPHVYDMHSSLPEQFANFGRFNVPPIVAMFRAIERYTLTGSAGVIAICDDLAALVRKRGYGGELAVIENTLQFGPPPSTGEGSGNLELRARHGLNGEPVVLYAGTLEQYQGLELLIEAAPDVRRDCTRAHFVIVGGTENQVAKLRKSVRRWQLEPCFTLVPAVSPTEVRRYYEMANVLVTCRTRGSNTPLKIYHYLHAGKPIVATAIRSHTQVLNNETAELVEPTPRGIAAGIVRVLRDGERAERLGAAAGLLARTRYDQTVSTQRLADLLDRVRARTSAQPQ